MKVINDWLNTGLSFLVITMVAFGLLVMATLLGAKGVSHTSTLRERVRISSRWSGGLSDKVQYAIVVVTALFIAALVVWIGGVAGFVVGGVVLLLFMALRYWFAR